MTCAGAPSPHPYRVTHLGSRTCGEGFRPRSPRV